jgi:hypothetical protein
VGRGGEDGLEGVEGLLGLKERGHGAWQPFTAFCATLDTYEFLEINEELFCNISSCNKICRIFHKSTMAHCGQL